MPEKTSSGTLRLRDGRTIGFAVFGDPNGKPGFYLHGFPGTRLEARIADAEATRLGVCIIALDRPGFGLSDYKPGRSITEWTDDLVEAADAFGIDRFPVMGLSGGGPYAAACALNVPHRLSAVAIVSGMAPVHIAGVMDGMSRQSRFFFALAHRLPPITRLAMWWMGRQVKRDPACLLDRMRVGLPESDKAVLARPEVRATLQDDMFEAFRQGSQGAAWELSLLARPWGFRLRDVGMEVHLWHGEADTNVPPAMGHYLADAIPHCRPHFYPAEGHLLAVNRMEEIQAALFA